MGDKWQRNKVLNFFAVTGSPWPNVSSTDSKAANHSERQEHLDNFYDDLKNC